MERRLTAILAADIARYSRLMGADEAGTLAQLKEIRSKLVAALIELAPSERSESNGKHLAC